jgi:transcriptional regulator with XRE-family HTH domain
MGHGGTSWATMGLVSQDAPPPGTLDPTAVTTLEELSSQLALLRLTAPRPRATDQPLTLRELADLTGLPRSTLGNAESGRVIPRVEVVYKIAEVCGVPEPQRAMWVQARNLVAHTARPHRRTRRARYVDPVTAAQQLADRDDRSPARAAVDFLAARSVRASTASLDQALDALPSALCAEYLTTMPTTVAATCLNLMSPSRGAACLDVLPPAVTARLLQRVDTAMVVEHLPLMQENTRWKALLAVPMPVVARWLTAMPRAQACSLAAQMPTPWIRELIGHDTAPCSLAADLYFVAGHKQISDLPATLRVNRLAGLLATMAPDPAAGLLTGQPRPRARRVLEAMQESPAARILAHLPILEAGALMTALPAHRAAMILASLPPQTAAALLAPVTTARQQRLLAAMPNDRRVTVEEAIPLIQGDPRLLKLLDPLQPQPSSPLGAVDLATTTHPTG